MHPDVQAMLDDGQAPTCSLKDFRDAMREDPNLWWKVDSGHQLNLFEDAVGRLDRIYEVATENAERLSYLTKGEDF